MSKGVYNAISKGRLYALINVYGKRKKYRAKYRIHVIIGRCVTEVWMRLLTNRLGRYAKEKILAVVQGGFRSRKRCADQVLELRGLCELRKRRNMATWLGFMMIKTIPQ